MDYKTKIEEARQNGYTDEEIVNYLSDKDDKVKEALANGYKPEEIVNYLETMGSNNQDTQPTQKSQSVQDTQSNNLIDAINMPSQTFDIPGESTQNMDTQTTMTQSQMQASEAADAINKKFMDDTVYATKQISIGSMSTFAGIYKSGLDLLSLVPGLGDTSVIQDAQKGADEAIKFWNDLSKEVAKKEGYSEEGILAPNNLGRMLPLFLAPTTTPLRTAIALNGALAYAESRGEGKTARGSLLDGAIAGGLTYGTLKIFDYLATPTAVKVLNDLKEKLNLDDTAAKKIYKEYKTVMEDDGPNSEVKALLWYAGKNKLNIGTKYITKVAKESLKASKNIEHEIMERKNVLKSLVRNKYNSIDDFAKDIQFVETQIKDDYTKFQQKVGNIKTKNVISSFSDDIPITGPEWDSLSDALKSDLYKIKELSTKDDISLADLTEAYKSVNKLLASPSAKGTSKGYTLNQIKTAIDKEISKSMPKEDYKIWKQINKDYATLLTYKRSKLGELIDSIIGNNAKKGTYSVDTILQKLPNVTESVDTFRAIRDLVGTEKATKLENFIIDETLNKVDDFNWARFNNMIGKKGFVSNNAKTLKELSDKFEKYFKVDNLYTKALADLELKEGAKTTVVDMFKALGVKQVANMITKALPNEFGKEARFVSRLTKILEKPSNVRKIEEAIESMSIEGRQKILNDVVKLLEYKPDAITKIVDETVNYVTPGGKVIKQGIKDTSTKVSKAVLEEHQDKIIKDFVYNSLKGERPEVINKAMQYFNENKINSMLKQAREELGKDYQTKWSKVYNTIVKHKVDELASKIENDLGIKLPKNQLIELYKREWKKDIILNAPRYKDLSHTMAKIAGKDNIKALTEITKHIARETKQLSKKLGISEDEAFKILIDKLGKDCK